LFYGISNGAGSEGKRKKKMQKAKNKKPVNSQPECRTVGVFYRDNNGGVISGGYRTFLEVTPSPKKRARQCT